MSNRPNTPSQPLDDEQNRNNARRWIVTAVLIPFAFLAVLALAVAYRIHAGNRAAVGDSLLFAPAPLARTSILVFSPHPDDETLGVGGLIQETLRAGGKVHVVFLTNGDAFRVGVADYYKILQVKPADYIRYGEMRQKEALSALETLGLSAMDVTFLGYPDRGLMGMWESSWLPSARWTSHYSQAYLNPYPNAPTYGKPYCGANVIQDIESQIQADQPTDIYVTHPTDDHPDHSAAASFVIAAVHALQSAGDESAYQVRIHFFLIHRGDWPVPQGLYPDLTIAPPSAFVGLDTQWQTLQLPSDVTIRKKAALDKYISQEEMMNRFLLSFIRKNEVFGELPEANERAMRIVDASAQLSERTDDRTPLRSVAKDPIADTVLRQFQPGGDIKEILAARSNDKLYITLAMQTRLSREITYRLSLRPFDRSMHTAPSVTSYSFSPLEIAEDSAHALGDGATVTWSGKYGTFVIPFKALGVADPTLVFVQGTTTVSQVKIDHTGYRPVFLIDSPRVPPPS